jgi:hypothetical protein
VIHPGIGTHDASNQHAQTFFPFAGLPWNTRVKSFLVFVHAIQGGPRNSQHRSTTCKYRLFSYTYCSVKPLHAANIKPSCTYKLSPSSVLCTLQTQADPTPMVHGPEVPKMGRNECIHYLSGSQDFNTLNMRRPFLDLACTSFKSYSINTHAAMAQGPNLD